MKKKNLPLLQNIEITGVAAEGKAFAKITDDQLQINNMVVFVPYCVPGDIVDLQVTKKKHSFMEARVARLIKPSDKRCEPVCKHYGICGGCKWQILPYDEQLRWKQQQITDNLTRIGKLQLPPISPILGSAKTYEYRNKLEFTFANHKWLTTEQMAQLKANPEDETLREPALGFHIPNCFDKVLQIDECHLMPNIQNEIRNAVRDYAIANNIPFYNERSHEGQLRNMMIRNNHLGELMVVIVIADKNTPIDGMMTMLHERFPQIISLMYCVNEKMNDTIGDLPVQTFYGQDYIMEHMENLQFKVGPKSFYQTNTDQAYELYKVARRFALEAGKEKPLIYDLYTGTGTIANFVAQYASKVIGIEYVEDAVADARINAQLNGLTNTEFFAGDMKDILTSDFIAQHGKPDVIITDPPRAGMHEDVVNVILHAAPERIVYVSCNPATQARDLALLDADYQIDTVQPVDMFPQTQHVENVVLLTRRA